MRAVISSLAAIFLMVLVVSGQTPATNPVGADAASIAAGRAIYETSCASCHGETGKGDGRMGEELNPKPSDLTSSSWKHGTTDRDIFSEVRNGIRGTGMKAFGHKLTARQIWDLVNYLHTIGPARGRSRPPVSRGPGDAMLDARSTAGSQRPLIR
jgi:cbb3-type cytochrome c oxidase subunit III